MLDLVLLLVEFTFPEEVIDGFIILFWVVRYRIKDTRRYVQSQGIDLRGYIPTPCFSVLL